MIINISSAWDTIRTEHNSFLKTKIQKFLDTPSTKSTHTQAKKFVRWIEPYILSKKPECLLHTINKFEKKRRRMSKLEFNNFKIQLETIFNYENFIKKKVHMWDAYKLCEKFSFEVCPYCHQAYIFTIVEEKGIRPTLDHYYLKDEYPFLALALNNFIPSCATCNSSLKGMTNFFTTPHLNPLVDKESIHFYCKKDGYTILDIISNFENLKHELNIELTHPITCEKSKSSMEVFMLQARYKKINRLGVNFVGAKTSIDNSAGLLNFYAAGPQLPGDALDFDKPAEEIIKRQFPFDRSNYKNEIHGKMFADLYDQFDRSVIFTTHVP